MVWWEAVLSPALQVLLDKLASGEILEFLRKWDISAELIEKLKIAYFSNTLVLDDAEEKQHSNPAVEAWLDMLKDAAFEAEDVLDELATAAIRWKLDVSLPNQVRTWNFISNFNPFNEKIESRIQKIIDKLEYVAKQKEFLGLEADIGQRNSCVNLTTSLLIDSHVYGRDKDLDNVIQLLLDSKEASKGEICAVPILGMGGVGKTTLAKCVFNDARVDSCFNVKAWTCVSDSFNVVTVTKRILESVTRKPWGTDNLELLQISLKRELNQKKLLLVLDDVWYESYDNWKELMTPLMAAAHGSKIIVTTRNQKVVTAIESLPPYSLKELPDDACWSLFLNHAFGNKNPDDLPNLRTIGHDIMKRCKGLPLAAKGLGSLLSPKLETKHWNNILYRNLWEFPSKKSNILSALRSSYRHLPANLKQCFAYCSIFPKDYEFDREQLVLLWMAEGFVQQVVDESKTLEEVGQEYFDNLLSRSFFQESPFDNSRYVMHDLINDLAHSVSRNLCVRLDDKLKSYNQLRISERTRHFSFIRGKYDVYKKFEGLNEVKRLRTFLPLASPFGIGFCYLSNKVPNDLLPKLRFLRVLSLSGYYIIELPETIGSLRHLRYFDLSHTAIKSLPESICCLHNLQTLILNDCDSLAKLPMNLGNLVNLRYLDVCRSGLQEMPMDIGRLISLQRLPEFIVGNHRSTGINELRNLQMGSGRSSGIDELRDLQQVQGTLTISKLENVINAWDAKRANLTDKRNLDELVLEWSSNSDGLQNERIQLDILEMSQPHQKLKRVSIQNYGGLKFPTWLGDPSFCSLVILECSNCKKCTRLPPLGQLPSLKKLYIKGMDGIKGVGAEFYVNSISIIKPFPLLETLCFEEMLEWEEWSSFEYEHGIEGFPCLIELQIKNCPKLRTELPNHFTSLKKLVIHEAERLKPPLPLTATLSELYLKKSDAMLFTTAPNLTRISHLQIYDIVKLTHIPDRILQQLTELKNLDIIDCCDLSSLWKNESNLVLQTSLQRLVIRNCPVLVTMLEEEEQLPIKLEHLEVECCHNLERLPTGMENLTSLRELIIKDCQKLVISPDANFTSMLRGLAVQGCGFGSLPEWLVHNLNSPLESIYISGCYNFTSFSTKCDHLPTTFQQLTINNCPSLESLPKGLMHVNNLTLKVLEIFDCFSLSSFPTGQLPGTLKTLTIWNCTNLESLADVEVQENMSLESFRVGYCSSLKCLPNDLWKLMYLDYLEIDGCPGLESFPEGGFPTNSLKKVYISNCDSLKCLPDGMQNLTSLQELHLSECPSFKSLPEGGFPINLISLEIKDCENICPLSEWDLHRLNSLEKLSITGGCSELSSFPEWLLPSSLTCLHIGRLALPVDGLPNTLSRLEICDCPTLEQQCEKDLPKIDHIPCTLM
ncbi:NB-ARC domain-containing disease resistance protein [Euphorbia peplus]|nr:NB-ARC domain-containing disease resistance protein [Euphorbia peplus]